MNKLILLASAASLALVACGDNHAQPDAFKHVDAKEPDAAGVPAVPTPGAQVDRMGRPAINTALNHVFDVDATAKGAAKDAYNQDAAAGAWPTSYGTEFAKNLALLDFLDSGLACGSGTCSGSAGHNGCGNQALYNGSPSGGGSATTASYSMLAGVLADDELYVDTSKNTCGLYLAVEFGVVTGLSNTTCGGRQPIDDVIDFSYTALAIGLGGFDTNFKPFFGDGVSKHTDVDPTTFPFLGTPHNP